MAYTLANLRDQVRQRADMEASKFISDAELNIYINQSYNELYDILISRYADYYYTLLPFTIPGGVNTFALPGDFYKLMGLDFEQSGITRWVSVYPFQFIERNRIAIGRILPIGRPIVSYRIMGDNLIIYPPEYAAGNYQMWYTPRLAQLVSDLDECDKVMDWTDYIVVDAAIKCLVKEESDPTVFMQQKEALKARIQAVSNTRDEGIGERIGDARTGKNTFYPFEL